MNPTITQDPIRVLNEPSTLWNTIDDIITSKDQENPFYVCDVDDIIQKYRAWKEAMPRVKPHYAIKCNDHPTVLKVMASLGLGFDCASKLEINKVLSLGVHPDRIIFAHTTKPPSHIIHAANVNVKLMTFDNELELHKIKKLFPSASAVIRIRYDAKAAVCLGLKFGCDPITEAPNLLQIASNLGINVVGVSFHVGWGCGDPSAFYGAIASARGVFDVASTLGYNLNLLDIGGGYPGEQGSSINKYAEAVNLGLERFFPSHSVNVISEPGTYFVDSAFSLACNIIAAKKIVNQDPDTTTQYMYYLNDGVYGSLSMTISANVIKIPHPLKKYSDAKKYPSIVWGPTCDSTDQINGNVLLPEMQLGDWLIFTDMGAYTLTLITPFNSFEPPNVYSIISRNNWLLLHNKSPFVEADFIIEPEKTNSKVIDLNEAKERHYDFPESAFVRG